MLTTAEPSRLQRAVVTYEHNKSSQKKVKFWLVHKSSRQQPHIPKIKTYGEKGYSTW